MTSRSEERSNARSPAGGDRTAVHWLTRAAADVPAGDGWLAAGEAAHLAGLRMLKRRRDWRLGRWTAKAALAAYLAPSRGAMAPDRLAVLAAPDGAPEASLDGDPLPVVISFSHSGGRALCAVAGGARGSIALGCDLEGIEERSAAFVRDYFTRGERALIAAAPAAAAPLLANLLWSAKESALKALRTGLRLDTRKVEVHLPAAGTLDLSTPSPDEWSPLEVRQLPAGATFGGWWRRAGEQVMTVVADPAAAPPVELAT